MHHIHIILVRHTSRGITRIERIVHRVHVQLVSVASTCTLYIHKGLKK